MKPRVEVWLNDRLTFGQEYRSAASARRELTSRIETCLNYGLTVTVTKDDGWWVFTCEQDGARHQIKLNSRDFLPPPQWDDNGSKPEQELSDK